MSQIRVAGLTFCYEGSWENVFEDVSFHVDTSWKLGFIGRNGKGKTTFLKLLKGEYEYTGVIDAPCEFQYFPYEVPEEKKKEMTLEVVESLKPDVELWKICRELELLKVNGGILYQPFETLSYGEQTKVMLAALFSGENAFLLIDEPTNHLDSQAREIVCNYLGRKKGFILVSHDRNFLDACVDHILSLERNQIQVEKGNFSTWWENKQRRDHFELTQNEKHKGEIKRLQEAARRTSGWADASESRKIGYIPEKDTNRNIGTRAYLGEKSRKMQQRRKNLKRRQEKMIEEKSSLLKNLETPVSLKLMPLVHPREVYIRAKDLSLFYGEKEVIRDFQMELRKGERVFLQGKNGCGKSTLLKAVLGRENVSHTGILEIPGGLKISYMSQDTSWLQGALEDFLREREMEESLFKALLRQLDFDRAQFLRPMETYSQGQKKKVLIAASLIQPAHLYLWDEPFNYIDVFSRMQIENLILEYKPTMLIVEHDRVFAEKCGTKVISF